MSIINTDNNVVPTFINQSGLPINIETWQYFTSGISQLCVILVKPGEELVMPSVINEWYLQTLLYEKEMADKWREMGITPGYRIGKFWTEPDVRHHYVYMEDTNFDILYEKEANTATFIKKSYTFDKRER